PRDGSSKLVTQSKAVEPRERRIQTGCGDDVGSDSRRQGLRRGAGGLDDRPAVLLADGGPVLGGAFDSARQLVGLLLEENGEAELGRGLGPLSGERPPAGEGVTDAGNRRIHLVRDGGQI